MLRTNCLAIAVVLWTSGVLAEREHAAETGWASKGGPKEAADTVTWWCVDLSQLWDLEVPIASGYGNLVPPDPSPVPPCAKTSSWPVTVAAGARWSAGGALIWYTNTEYTPQARAALSAQAYHFAGARPVEDLLEKVLRVTYVVVDAATWTEVARFSFKGQSAAKVVKLGKVFASLPFDPIVNPTFDVNLDPAAVALLPAAHFGGVVRGGLPPGQYNVEVYWTLSAPHNDGLGLDPGDFLSAGDNLMGYPSLNVTP